MDPESAIIICPYCGLPATVIWVHGHGQCSYCKTNLDECCRGEIIDMENNDNTDEHKMEEDEESDA